MMAHELLGAWAAEGRALQTDRSGLFFTAFLSNIQILDCKIDNGGRLANVSRRSHPATVRVRRTLIRHPEEKAFAHIYILAHESRFFT